MKNRRLFSILGATALMAGVAFPAVAGDNSTTFREPYVPDVGAAPNQYPKGANPAEFNQLPARVEATIRSQCGVDTIGKIKEGTMNGQTVYRVQFQRQSDLKPRPELVIATDGTILKEKHLANIGVDEHPLADVPSNR
ncbi:MAG TPA: hypothetical protein VH619_00195 [Verrucomicrobiae bacterium]|jgi:hypothetical protein|nr:hypothetical protein [Verrucomicrobiae bacterium]